MGISIRCDHCKAEVRCITPVGIDSDQLFIETRDYDTVLVVKVPDLVRIRDVTGKGKRMLCQMCQRKLDEALKEF